ncbi:unnamed protein product [Coffea canephora]|uniref:NB-ARC domain-containing protein n=1 Tax=Coffea canephora TaxID=49390 RepID=A0A068URH9_COFCA|nr:unnamed protein product [Coffea canephora]
MAESILSSILSSAVENIGKLLIEEGKFLQGVSDQVTLLRDDLDWIQMFLRYADTRQTARDTIQQCVPKFRAVAYEASDLVEDYALRVSISRNGGFTSTLKRIACIATECYARHNLGVEIQSLRTRISNLTKNFGEYRHVMTRTEEGESSAPSRQQQLRRTYSFVPDKDVVELPNDVQVLVKYLLNEVAEHKISVASIFGMGGIGKTTLARKLARLLQRHLQDNKCLIVLDDLWSTEAWDCLKDAIPVSEHGSKILLTTRNRDVAEHVDPIGYHHKLRCLTDEESLELLRLKSLRERSGEGCEDLDKMEEGLRKKMLIGKEMLKYCGGLPLAVVVLGGILRTKTTLREWNEVHENIKSYLDKGEKIGREGEVPKVLAYSYYDLPWQLKPCFLYLGKFREDSDIRAESLYQMWIGEGMIFENDRREQETMMDVAERYLEELAIRCMVEIKAYEEGKHAVTKLESCRLHDLMRDLCLAKAKEENLYKLVDRTPSRDSPPATEAQYGLVVYLSEEDSSQYNFPPKEQTKHLRSFFDLFCRIPNVLWKLEHLLYLYLPDWERWDARPAQPKLRLSKQLEILESFNNRFCYPKDVCKLSNLRSFKAYVYKNLEDLEHIINHISNLDCLRISSLQIYDFDFGGNRGLDVLSRVLFSRNIHELEIRGLDSLCKKLPDYQFGMFTDPAGLTDLMLKDTKIEEDPMATLEKLPNLRTLELGPKSFLGQEMICHSAGFPQLKHLVLDSLGNLKQWKVEEGAMPKLSGLRIECCTKLAMIPDGLRCLTTLEEVTLVDMPEEFNNRVRIENGQQGEDYDKISHVPKLEIRSFAGIRLGYLVETVRPRNPV